MPADLYPQFMADIIAAPDDDTPRLALADWLEEDGQPERAEFIRVQCELATFSPGYFDGSRPEMKDTAAWHPRDGHPSLENMRRAERFKLLEARDKALLKPATAGAWGPWCAVEGLGEIRPGPCRVGRTPYAAYWAARRGRDLPGICANFRRGFVEEVGCSAPYWTEHGGAVLVCQPVRAANLYVGLWSEMESLVLALNCLRLRELTLWFDRAFEDWFPALTGFAPGLKRASQYFSQHFPKVKVVGDWAAAPPAPEGGRHRVTFA